MSTLILGAFGYGNLGDEWCLAEAIRHSGDSKVLVGTLTPELSRAGVEGIAEIRRTTIDWLRFPHEVRSVRPERVLLGGGGLGVGRMFSDLLVLAGQSGVPVEVHNIELDPSFLSARLLESHVCRRILRSALEFSLRDSESLHLAQRLESIGGVASRTLLPEANLTFVHASFEPVASDVLWSVSNFSSARTTLYRNAHVLPQLVDATQLIAPSVGHVWDRREDDLTGSLAAISLLASEGIGNGRRVEVAQVLRVGEFRRLVEATQLVISDRKHVLLHAAVAGVPAIAVERLGERRVTRFVSAVRERFPDCDLSVMVA